MASIPRKLCCRVRADRLAAAPRMDFNAAADEARPIADDPHYGPAFHDQPILAMDKVRFAGEPVALVLANDPHVAQAAAALIEVDYEPLPAVYDEVDAMTSKAVVHEVLKPAGTFPDLKHLAGKRDTNIGTGCMVVTKDYDSDWVNVGTYRVMIHDRNHSRPRACRSRWWTSSMPRSPPR